MPVKNLSKPFTCPLCQACKPWQAKATSQPECTSRPDTIVSSCVCFAVRYDQQTVDQLSISSRIGVLKIKGVGENMLDVPDGSRYDKSWWISETFM